MMDLSDMAAVLVIPFFIIILILISGTVQLTHERDEWKAKYETLENILRSELHIVVDEENNEYRR